MKHRQINFVIKDEQDMLDLITFLVYSIKTIDGNKNSALPFIKDQKWAEADKYYKTTIFKYKLLKWRMKISLMAAEKQQTVKELFLSTILKSYS